MQNKEQFEELFRNNYGQMLRLSMLIVKDEEESKDIVSDIFTEIWDGAINPYVDKPRSYLMMCVRNRCLDLLNHKRIKERVSRLLILDSSLPAINNDTPDMQRLRDIVDTLLSARDRQVLIMKYERKMKYREISDELKISQVAVYKHLSQALKTLKANFK
jgi:RNA polymerase sigma factor (sigma-70 family)